MNYDTTRTPTDEDIAVRLAEAYDLKSRWQDIKKRYGEKVTAELKELTPADPYILYDLSAKSYMDEGKTADEAIAIVDEFKPKEWQRELKGFKPTILKAFEMTRKMTAELDRTPNG